MNIPTRRMALLFLGLSGACAVEPDPVEAVGAPDAPAADPTAMTPAPDGVRCRPGPPVPATRATSEAVTPSATQALPWVPQLYGERPDLVSGGASRVEGELWISFGYRRTEADVTTLRGRIVGADDETLELLPRDLSSIPRSPEYGPGAVQLLLPPNAARALARYVEVVVEDARGLRSATLRMPVTEVSRQPDGGACGRHGLFNICRGESLCSPAGRCTPVTAPTLTSAEAFASSGPSRSALTLRWDDPNQDVVAIEVTARGRREPLVIPVADPSRGGPWSQRWDADFFEGATWLNVRVRDQGGRFSNVLNVAVAAPAPAAAGDACDPSGLVSRCGAGLACTRDNGMSCICQWPRRTDPLWPSETDPPRVRFRGRSPRERGHLLTHPWPSGLTRPRHARVRRRGHVHPTSSALFGSVVPASRAPGPRVTRTSACCASRSSSAAVSLSSPKTRLHSPKERFDVRIVARRS
jgi:hypothetical protein